LGYPLWVDISLLTWPEQWTISLRNHTAHPPLAIERATHLVNPGALHIPTLDGFPVPAH